MICHTKLNSNTKNKNRCKYLVFVQNKEEPTSNNIYVVVLLFQARGSFKTMETNHRSFM